MVKVGKKKDKKIDLKTRVRELKIKVSFKNVIPIIMISLQQ